MLFYCSEVRSMLYSGKSLNFWRPPDLLSATRYINMLNDKMQFIHTRGSFFC